MYFANTKHEKNYEYLMPLCGVEQGKNVQHEASIYIVSYPNIYDCVNWEIYDFEFNPLFALASWNEEKEEYEFENPALTGSTRRMCAIGASLFNGYPVSLDETFGAIRDEEVIDVLIQAIKIRLGYLSKR